MSNCKQCGKELVHVQGRREKVYCNPTCKSAWFTKNKPKYVPKNEKLPKGVRALRAIVGYAFDMEELSKDKVEQFQETHPQKYIKVEALTLEGYNKNPLIKNAIDSMLSELMPQLPNKSKDNQQNTNGKPTKMIGESSLDYNIRIAEWQEKNK